MNRKKAEANQNRERIADPANAPLQIDSLHR